MAASTAFSSHLAGSSRGKPPDVVAGLVNDGSAFTVARAAVVEAVRRAGRVRFVQVTQPGLDLDERDGIDRATFRSALRAMRGMGSVPCTFEVVAGDPATVLVERSQSAALLVVGTDRPGEDHDVARCCRERACCDVLTVDDG